jgi:hypothetical protein
MQWSRIGGSGSPALAGAGPAPGAEAGGPVAVPPQRAGVVSALRLVARFARRHALFGVLLLAAAAVRVIVMLGFRGPLLYPDSTGYVADAVRLAPGLIRPSGYPIMLWLLKPFHSLAFVLGVQHAMGLAAGIVAYALLRRAGLPGWGATIAAVPVLLSAYAIQIEHFPLSDTLFAFLVIISVALVMWWRDPPVWACALAGLLLAAAALARSEGIPLLLVLVACLLIRFAGWRTIAGVIAACVAFTLPMVGYAAWFHSVRGSFQISASSGAYLYSGVTPFADCAKIKPPPAERRLCLNVPVSERGWPGFYIWSSTSPIHAVPGGPFGKRADSLGTRFALLAIRAQPLDYLRVAGRAFWESFLPPPSLDAATILQRSWAQSQLGYTFPAAPPRALLPRYALRDFSAYDPAGPGLRVVKPYAGWIRAYQRYVVLQGPLLGVIVLAGLGGVIVAWRRRGGPALLPWLTGLCLLVTPSLIAEFDLRYLVCTIPPLCVAAAIGVQQMAGAAQRYRAGRRPSAP